MKSKNDAVKSPKKFIYTQTLKTGGTSVESYFEKYCMRDGEWVFARGRPEYVSETGIIGCRGNNYANFNWYNHMSAYEIKKRVENKIWNEYFKFCVIRNPYNKLISAFFHFEVKRNNLSGSKEELIKLFREWARTEKRMRVDRDKYLIGSNICMNAFIRTESMLIDLENVCNKLGRAFYSRGFTKA